MGVFGDFKANVQNEANKAAAGVSASSGNAGAAGGGAARKPLTQRERDYRLGLGFVIGVAVLTVILILARIFTGFDALGFVINQVGYVIGRLF